MQDTAIYELGMVIFKDKCNGKFPNRNLNRTARKQMLIFLSSVSPPLSTLITTKENILFTILSLIPDP